MRITGGMARGHRILPPPATLPIRPSTDLLRESLGNILGPAPFAGAVLDLFAGSGAVGLEALSRGAQTAVFVDRDATALQLIRQNLSLLGRCLATAASCHILRHDLTRGLELLRRTDLALPHTYSLIYLDPPYEKNLALPTMAMVEKTGLLAPEGFMVVEERWPASLPQRHGTLSLVDSRRYGKSGLWFYRLEDSP